MFSTTNTLANESKKMDEVYRKFEDDVKNENFESLVKNFHRACLVIDQVRKMPLENSEKKVLKEEIENKFASLHTKTAEYLKKNKPTFNETYQNLITLSVNYKSDTHFKVEKCHEEFIKASLAQKKHHAFAVHAEKLLKGIPTSPVFALPHDSSVRLRNQSLTQTIESTPKTLRPK